MTSPRRSVASIVTALLAMLALLAAGAAFWTARETREQGVDRSEVERLRLEIDSLRLRINQLEEPFGPAGAPPTSAPPQ